MTKMAIPVLCALMPQMAFIKIVKCMLDTRHIRAKSLGLCDGDELGSACQFISKSTVALKVFTHLTAL